MSQLRKMIGEELTEIIKTARSGGPVTRIGLMASGSELGTDELLRGALEAHGRYRDIQVVMIGPKTDETCGLEWIETAEDEQAMAQGMEKALKERNIDGAVALHYPFPLGVTTVGRVMTPARGNPMFIASTTGTSATSRIEAMVLNALYGIAVAKSTGIDAPSVGILNVDGAQTVYRSLKKLNDNGYDINDRIWVDERRNDSFHIDAVHISIMEKPLGLQHVKICHFGQSRMGSHGLGKIRQFVGFSFIGFHVDRTFCQVMSRL